MINSATWVEDAEADVPMAMLRTYASIFKMFNMPVCQLHSSLSTSPGSSPTLLSKSITSKSVRKGKSNTCRGTCVMHLLPHDKEIVCTWQARHLRQASDSWGQGTRRLKAHCKVR